MSGRGTPWTRAKRLAAGAACAMAAAGATTAAGQPGDRSGGQGFVLVIDGPAGAGFSGTCEADGPEGASRIALDGAVPHRAEIAATRLTCRIESRGGPIEVNVTDGNGNTTRSVSSGTLTLTMG
ncbi:MAG: hypothetical protein ACTS3R_16140 [Inquilinaceae bacterium]